MGKTPPPYSIKDVARMLNLCPRVVTQLFEREPGVIVYEVPNVMRKRKHYRTIRVPRHVYERVLARLTRR